MCPKLLIAYVEYTLRTRKSFGRARWERWKSCIIPFEVSDCAMSAKILLIKANHVPEPKVKDWAGKYGWWEGSTERE
jgi:hypothetical protein